MSFNAVDAFVEVSWVLELGLRFWANKLFKNRILGFKFPCGFLGTRASEMRSASSST